MKPEIVELDTFTVMGVLAHGNPQKIDFSALWEKRFMSHSDKIEPLSTDGAYYGVSFGTEDDDVIDHIAGMAVESVGDIPDGLVARQVPAAQYAVFECKVKETAQTYEYIYDEWLPNSDQYEYDIPKPDFEYYPPDTESDDSPVFIHVPVREIGS